MKSDGILGNPSILSSCQRWRKTKRICYHFSAFKARDGSVSPRVDIYLYQIRWREQDIKKGDLAARVIGVEVVERSQIGEGCCMNWKEWKKSY